MENSVLNNRSVILFKGARLEILAKTDQEFYVVPLDEKNNPMRNPFYVKKEVLNEAIQKARDLLGKNFNEPNCIQ